MQPGSILQTYLDDVGRAIMADRFESYGNRIRLPLDILTSSARLKVSTLEDLQDGFEDFVDMMQSLGVTDMLRTVRTATFQGNAHIVGIYDTRVMNGDRQVLPTFHSKIWIGCYDGAWQAIKVHNTTRETRWPMLLTRLDTAHWLPEEF